MSTRSIIARQVGDGWTGRYHHSDGYPTGVGNALLAHIRGHFAGDVRAAMAYLIDQHPAGWQSIVGANLRLAPGFGGGFRFNVHRPQCYCHGDRDEEEDTRTQDNLSQYWDIDFLYVIAEDSRMLTAFALDHDWGDDPINDTPLATTLRFLRQIDIRTNDTFTEGKQ